MAAAMIGHQMQAVAAGILEVEVPNVGVFTTRFLRHVSTRTLDGGQHVTTQEASVRNSSHPSSHHIGCIVSSDVC